MNLFYRASVLQLVFCLYCLTIIAQPQNFVLTQITEEQGLPGVTVRSIFQDKNDVFWFGVESGGLCKYDGHRFTLYANNPEDSNSIGSNFINIINQDSSGLLWIGTEDGLYKFDIQHDKFVHFHFNSKNTRTINGKQVYSIAVNYKGQIWVGTNNGLNLYNSTSGDFHRILLNINGKEFENRVNSISVDLKNNLWLGTSKGLLYYNVSNGTIKIWENNPNDYNSLPHNQVSSILLDSDSIIWLCTRKGVAKFNMKSNKFKLIDQLSNVDSKGNYYNFFPLTLMKDRQGLIWTGEQMVAVYNPKTEKVKYFKQHKNNHEGLRSASIRAIFEDRSGLVWIASKFGGLQIYNRNREIFPRWKALIENDNTGLTDSYSLCFTEDNDNNLWVGTRTGGLNILNLKTGLFSYISHDPNNNNSLIEDRINCMLPDGERYLWMGTISYLEKYDKLKKQFTHIQCPDIASIANGEKDQLMLGTSTRGIVLFNKKTSKITPFEDKTGIFPKNSNLNIPILFNDGDSLIWIGTHSEGLYKYRKGKAIEQSFKYNSEDSTSISSDQIRSIYRDSHKRLWIGTRLMGLNLFDEKNASFKHFTVRDGLPSNSIYSILEDNNSNLWLGTHYGISLFKIKENRFENFNKDFGLQSNIFINTAYFKTKSGKLVLGGENGFNLFDPSKVYKPEIKSHMIISTIKVYDEVIERDLVHKKSIKLDYNRNFLSFEFSLLDYTEPNRNRYKCLMSGVDKDWVNCNNRNYITYSNLAPGNYSFKVMGSNAYGVWQESISEVEIVILPPWWQTWVFRVFAIFFILVIIIGIYLIRLNSLRKQKKQLEQLVKIRTQELEEKNYELELQDELLRSKTKELIHSNDYLNEANTNLEERQQRIEEQTEELKTQAEDMFKINQELKLLVATKDKFFSIIAHDLKNPLSLILGFTELFVKKYKKFDEEKRLHYAEVIFQSTKQLFALLENLLQWARSQTGSIKFNPELLSLKEIVDANFGFHKGQAEKKGIVFINNVVDDVGVFADRNMIQTIMRNLTSNAIKYTEDGNIELSYVIKGDEVEVRIKDSGIGISKQKLEYLFNIDKNKSTEGTKGETGTGLGLIICKEFIVKNNGSIWVESIEGQSSTFYFTLPLYAK